MCLLVIHGNKITFLSLLRYIAHFSIVLRPWPAPNPAQLRSVQSGTDRLTVAVGGQVCGLMRKRPGSASKDDSEPCESLIEVGLNLMI